MRAPAEAAPGELAFTELHALTMADIDGDGLQDIVTGKRWWSHGSRYDDENDLAHPPVLYWFKLTRTADGQVPWRPNGSKANWVVPSAHGWRSWGWESSTPRERVELIVDKTRQSLAIAELRRLGRERVVVVAHGAAGLCDSRHRRAVVVGVRCPK